jgi:hypothetical protein
MKRQSTVNVPDLTQAEFADPLSSRPRSSPSTEQPTAEDPVEWDMVVAAIA